MKLRHLLLVLLLSSGFIAHAQNTPSVKLKKIASVTAISAVCVGQSEGVTNILEQGVCWSVSSNPTINDGHASGDTKAGKFISRIYGLEENTTYYVRAYLKTALCCTN